jgi:D-hydroxyproline dehydrogenase subunit gamma
MPDAGQVITVFVNGAVVEVPAGSTIVAALLLAGDPCRNSVSGEPRTALCGMGICLECRATVDGVPHRRTCQLLCQPGMRVETGQ